MDMDAFYASIEQRDNPALCGKPVIVGAPPTQRGVVCAASYEARKSGVHSAMPSATAGRLCPKGSFVRPRMEVYKEESRQIMRLAAETGAVIEQMSIDEAYLDLSADPGGGYLRPAQASPARRAHRPGKGAVRRLHHGYPPNHRRRPADGSRRHLPAGLLSIGPRKTGVPSATVARPGGGQLARAERTAIGIAIELSRNSKHLASCLWLHDDQDHEGD